MKLRPFAGRFLAQNLGDKDRGKNKGRGWMEHARFFYFLPEGDDYSHVDQVEWVIRRKPSRWRLGATLDVEPPFADDHDYRLRLMLGPLTVYVTAVRSTAARRKRWDEKGGVKIRHREYGAEVSGRGIYLHLGNDPMEWNRSDPWWWQIEIHPRDLLLGKLRYSSEPLGESRVPVVLPEGAYAATVKMERARWVRPRAPFWPFTEEIIRADIEPDIPIPIPGKGENSWDLHDDAIYSQTAPANSPEEAALKLAESVMQAREKYASQDWEPAAGWPERG